MPQTRRRNVMRDIKYIKHAIISTIFGAFVLVGTVLSVSAQDPTQEYRDWQRAQQRAEQRHQVYLRTNSIWDYNQWQAAQRQAQQQYDQYQRTLNHNNNSYYNNGYYNNNGYNNSYYNNSSYTPQYRVYSNGSYYSTDSRGAEMLRQAVRNGYAQGYQQGRMDRRFGRGYNYYSNNMYSNGSYGYRSYVDRNQYQYYFQQGFQRGYEDGYYDRYQYGYRSGNGFSIAAGVLNTILNIARNN